MQNQQIFKSVIPRIHTKKKWLFCHLFCCRYGFCEKFRCSTLTMLTSFTKLSIAEIAFGSYVCKYGCIAVIILICAWHSLFMAARIIKGRYINIHRHAAAFKSRRFKTAFTEHTDISLKDLRIHRDSNIIKTISERWFRRDSIGYSKRKLVKLFIGVKFIHIVKIWFSKSQKSYHCQQNISVFDLRLWPFFGSHSVGFFDKVGLAQNLSYKR